MRADETRARAVWVSTRARGAKLGARAVEWRRMASGTRRRVRRPEAVGDARTRARAREVASRDDRPMVTRAFASFASPFDATETWRRRVDRRRGDRVRIGNRTVRLERRARASETTARASETPERMDKLLSRLGYVDNRRDVARFLRERVVTTNGDAASARETRVKAKARPSDVRVDGEALEHASGMLIVMHKPAGVVCSHDAREGANVFELLPARWRRRRPSVETVGRLDKDTTGLLLLTDDGALNHALTTPKKDVGKWYRVRTDRAIPSEAVEAFASGKLTLAGEDKPCKPARCEILGDTEARLRLTEGKFHQVKRMFAVFECVVVELHRESFGRLRLADVAVEAGDFATLPLDFEFVSTGEEDVA